MNYIKCDNSCAAADARRQREIELLGFDGQATFAEFGPDSRTIFSEAMHGVGERGIYASPASSGNPSWSPLGDQIAFAVFRYQAHFWLPEE